MAKKTKRSAKAKATKKSKTKKTKTKKVVRRIGARAIVLSGPAAAAGQPTPAQIKRARIVVAVVFDERFGAPAVPDDTPLAKFGLNAANLAGIAANIRQHGIDVPNAPVQACGGKTYVCVVMAAAHWA
jgi:hypothetical protein